MTYGLGIKPIPAQESSGSISLNVRQVELPQTQTQQGVEALEKLLEQTPTPTPDVHPIEVKGMGRPAELSDQHKMKLLWLQRHFNLKTQKAVHEKLVDDAYVRYHDR
ncbi:hypothetical protein H6G17_25725 [Chroococcidiopsis sp. FACHB-1243]|uniref:hypothetical protein n=1 Tax=Chroococcidiopsis sp. [FACHB-1243] TaxID=2692781 RepID=UPI0017861E5A|nr:hypothetical protein [Chroococcidiopsis sp. [FACHB-1243]]MBD2308871.1 hypothetical protein [Chroococcidiopsis sp. [FACHB-1243]]